MPRVPQVKGLHNFAEGRLCVPSLKVHSAEKQESRVACWSSKAKLSIEEIPKVMEWTS